MQEPDARIPKYFWFRYRLLTLHIVTFVFCVGLTWYAYNRDKANEQRIAIHRVEEMGFDAYYDYQFQAKPGDLAFHFNMMASLSWTSQVLGTDYCHDVVYLCCRSRQRSTFQAERLLHFPKLKALRLGCDKVSEADLKLITALSELRYLSIIHCSDSAIASSIGHMKNLEVLEVSGKNVTDVSLKQFAELRGLLALSLGFTGMSDLGLKELAELNHLKCLTLEETNITDAGLKHLAELEGIEQLSLNDSQISDEGLKYLSKLKSLEWLDLGNTRISDDGIMQLSTLSNLKVLVLKQTNVTVSGKNRLHREIQNCQILIDLPDDRIPEYGVSSP